MKKFVLILLFNFLILNLFAQIDSAKAIQNKRKIVFTSAGTFYVGLYTSLGVLWYGKEKTSPFHFFNDNKEFLLPDIDMSSPSCNVIIVFLKLSINCLRSNIVNAVKSNLSLGNTSS